MTMMWCKKYHWLHIIIQLNLVLIFLSFSFCHVMCCCQIGDKKSEYDMEESNLGSQCEWIILLVLVDLID